MKTRMHYKKTSSKPVGNNRAIQQTGLASAINMNNLQAKICTCEGDCPVCSPIQPKLKTPASHDPYEKEADQVAAQVLENPIPTPKISPLPSVQRQTFDEPTEEGIEYPDSEQDLELQREVMGEDILLSSQEEEDEEEVWTKSKSPGRAKPTTELKSGLNQLNGQGLPLSGSVRQDFETRFGHDGGHRSFGRSGSCGLWRRWRRRRQSKSGDYESDVGGRGRMAGRGDERHVRCDRCER